MQQLIKAHHTWLHFSWTSIPGIWCKNSVSSFSSEALPLLQQRLCDWQLYFCFIDCLCKFWLISGDRILSWLRPNQKYLSNYQVSLFKLVLSNISKRSYFRKAIQCIATRQAEQSSSPCIWNIIHTGFYVPQPDFKSVMCNLHRGEVLYGMKREKHSRHLRNWKKSVFLYIIVLFKCVS